MKKFAAIFISMCMLFSLSACYTEDDLKDAEQSGYDSGYDTGYNEGYDIGYDEGYNEAKSEYPSDDDDNNDYTPDDGITDSSVFVTRTGDKYHTPYCRYVQGKNDLSYYDSAAEAEAAGYSPCSVCH